ncbi:uncharacterized protein LOC142638783 [Castanea sativa]|uniref:uncharacterized protein LOC142638783 n=1 Tax=Castanea sativa TaxID=21020 RepID=UPI003F64B7B7
MAQARVGFVVPRTEGSYSEFIKTHLEACLANQGPPPSEGEEKGDEEEEIPSPHRAGSFSSSFAETYPHFLAWQYDVMNPNGTYSSMPLNRPKYVSNVPWPDPVNVDLVEESMKMIGGLQSLPRT